MSHVENIARFLAVYGSSLVEKFGKPFYFITRFKPLLFRFFGFQCTQRPNHQEVASWISCAESLCSGIVRLRMTICH